MFNKVFPAGILSAYLIRLLVTGASIGDAIALTALAAFYSFYYYTESKKEPPVNEKLKEEIKVLNDRILNLETSFKALNALSKSPTKIARF